ncbi:hypothetical protein Halha_1973 [Halobacteroides halobius DSM 5150]|uniref:Uncharacterized protein n=1 Tax=Halobacteroides halobius (strain ATCC 35273 / DSM 5150 / MD-1) TaxID=748449 RepID=L0K9C0_HALHC|nr:hypothetical protein [Halobacteroides halobius]AGB41872.1 hypothetical protein Halha_1973 [Halobacteroides halobius DSM 5150]
MKELNEQELMMVEGGGLWKEAGKIIAEEVIMYAIEEAIEGTRENVPENSSGFSYKTTGYYY